MKIDGSHQRLHETCDAQNRGQKAGCLTGINIMDNENSWALVEQAALHACMRKRLEMENISASTG